MKKDSLIKPFILFLCLITFSSCASRSTYTAPPEAAESLPPDFMKTNSHLLVQILNAKAADKNMRKEMEMEYKGDYSYYTEDSYEKSKEEYEERYKVQYKKMLSWGAFGKQTYDLLNKPVFTKRYEDIDKYRYFLGNFVQMRAINGGSVNAQVLSTNKYYVLDRKTDKIYKYPGTGVSNRKYFRALVIALEAARLKNSN